MMEIMLENDGVSSAMDAFRRWKNACESLNGQKLSALDTQYLAELLRSAGMVDVEINGYKADATFKGVRYYGIQMPVLASEGEAGDKATVLASFDFAYDSVSDVCPS